MGGGFLNSIFETWKYSNEETNSLPQYEFKKTLDGIFDTDRTTLYKKNYCIGYPAGINIVLYQIARDARPAFGGPWPSVNLMTHLHAQGVNSRMKVPLNDF